VLLISKSVKRISTPKNIKDMQIFVENGNIAEYNKLIREGISIVLNKLKCI